ncbi:Maf family protein [Ferrigenium sp. UT5]|uniref:Maf family protein n=1 Tax=Ferrigenium sp. UT5 TaxID=3242105 RepID=UPI00354F744A
MSHTHPRIYLASQSPRRRELLKQIGVGFDLLLLRNDPRRQIDVDELPLAQESPAVYVERVCREKAQAALEALRLRALRPAPILTADTVVVLEQQIIGKPEDNAHAAEILRQLSGRSHEVITAVAVALGEHTECRVVSTRIRFAALDEARIRRYLASGEAHGKAGAYGIQGQAAAFVEHLEGSYSGVVGLPLHETVELLKSFGITTP